MRKFSFILILFFLAIGCDQVPMFRFKEPQPPDLNNLPCIPKQYYGKYLSTKDSSVITISPKLIIQEWNEYSEFEKSKMKEIPDSIYHNDSTIKLGHNWTMTVLINKDSVKMSTYQIDTLYQITGNEILRSYKCRIFINKKDGRYWGVDLLILKDNRLEISTLTDESNLIFMETIPGQTIPSDSAKASSFQIKRKVKPGEIRKVKSNSQFFDRI